MKEKEALDNAYKAIERHIKEDPVEVPDIVDRMEQLSRTLEKQVEITKDLVSVIDGFQDDKATKARLKALEKWEKYIHIEELSLDTANDALIGELYRIIYSTDKRAL